MSRKSKLLEELGKNCKDMDFEKIEKMDIEVLKDFSMTIENNLTDERADISYQPLVNIVMITFLALMGNANEWTEIYEFGVMHKEWLSKFLDLKYGIPSITTIRTTIGIIDTKELENICVNYMIKKIKELQELFKIEETDEKDIMAYDGKICKGSSRKNTVQGKIKPVNAMSAFNVTKDICVATKFIEEKTNEIPTGPELIKMLDLTNTISTFDALNTQEKTIEAIVKQNGNYVAAVKGNQGTLHNDIKLYFEDANCYKKAKEESYYEEKEKAHNCVEKRIYVMTSKIEWLEGKEKWKNIKSIGMVKRQYEVDNEKKEEIRYYITDLESNEIKDFKNAVRGEWGIENNLHWQLDYVFKEDANLTMNKQAQANLNILRKLCLNLLKLVKPLYNKSLKLIRFKLGQDFENEIMKVLLCLNTEALQDKIAVIQ